MSERTTASDSRRETTPRTKPKRFPSRVFVLVRARVGANEAMTPVVCVRSRKNKNAITVSSTRRRRRPSLLPPPPPPLCAAPRKRTFLPALRSETVFLESETPSPPDCTIPFRHPVHLSRHVAASYLSARAALLFARWRPEPSPARRSASRPRGVDSDAARLAPLFRPPRRPAVTGTARSPWRTARDASVPRVARAPKPFAAPSRGGVGETATARRATSPGVARPSHRSPRSPARRAGSVPPRPRSRCRTGW